MKKTNHSTQRPFKIEHIDSMGQGVSKIDSVLFIPKTLPGEQGTAIVTGKKGQVLFGEVQALQITSQDRKKPECPHFSLCGGCQYLHTSYEKEVEFKKANINRSLKYGLKSELPMEFHQAKHRNQYRSRIQLHYDLTTSVIGFKKAHSSQILKITQCLLPVLPIQSFLEKFLDENHPLYWKRNIPKNLPTKDKVEIRFKEEKVQTIWPIHLLEPDFTQVNSDENQKLIDFIRKEVSQFKVPLQIIDLFSGDGNLSNHLEFNKRWMFDLHEKEIISDGTVYQKLDLFKNWRNIPSVKGIQEANLIIIDPPRSGFKDVAPLLDSLESAKYIIFVSCHLQTLLRDHQTIKDKFQLLKVEIFDFFPSTRHFETVFIYERAGL